MLNRNDFFDITDEPAVDMRYGGAAPEHALLPDRRNPGYWFAVAFAVSIGAIMLWTAVTSPKVQSTRNSAPAQTRQP